MSLKRVDKLTITFLVDNTIEWFGKMPPGFTQEVRYQIAQNKPPIDDLTGLPILDLENYCCGAHGFAALIETKAEGETESHLTLFDAGPESKSITRNIAALKAPIERVERVVLSHWHCDHSGGILAFLRLRAAAGAAGQCAVDLHPDRPIARGIAPQPNKIICRLAPDPTFEEIEAAGGIVEKHDEGHVVADGTVFVSGEIPRVTEWEKGLFGGARWIPSKEDPSKGEWISEEQIMDERYAAIDVVGKGLVIFSSCSHAGVVNVAIDAVNRFKRPIHMIIGGLHLGGPELADRIEPTVDFFAKKLRPSPTYILPMHCSGFGVKVALEQALGDGCVPIGAGARIDVDGTPESEAAMFAPTIA